MVDSDTRGRVNGSEANQITNQMQMQKKRILAQRKKAGVDAKMQREKIQAAMEQVKQTKKWHKAGAIMKKALDGGSGSKSMKSMKRSKRSVVPGITTEETHALSDSTGFETP